jgi:hypothetical protein
MKPKLNLYLVSRVSAPTSELFSNGFVFWTSSVGFRSQTGTQTELHSVFWGQFCDVGKVVIIHKKI